MEISSGNLLLSKISIHDMDFICKIECDEKLWYFEESVQTDVNVVRNKYISKIEESGKPRSYDFVVSIEADRSILPIGLAQIWSYSDYRKSWEIGFVILPEYRGEGHGSDAAKLLLKFAFEKLEAHKVVGMCNSKNIRSAALM
ncbi:GNAT family N-acetyltransferase [Heyndrickxia sp. NPDC080065]|uniref:GNAT family N-acetyltransferase n=1 Tax=Heyndrickxia sp. NPDC080065 TaxID=3390568 RepID=UPI003CFD5EDD